MLFDLCTKDEGNPLTTKIWVVGSYTDTLLNLSSGNWRNEELKAYGWKCEMPSSIWKELQYI